MKLCEKCNLEYPDSVEYCTKCGSLIKKVVEQQISPSDYEVD